MLIVVTEAVLANESEAARLLAEAEPLIASTRIEPGCLSYSFARDALDPAIVHVVERWRDEAAMAAHMKSAHLARFMAVFQGIGLAALTAKVYDAGGERDLFA